MRVLRFLALAVLLNLIRYFVIGWIEWVTVLPPLFGAMAASPEVFRTDFTTFDWTTSYLYNFGVWLCAVRCGSVAGGRIEAQEAASLR